LPASLGLVPGDAVVLYLHSPKEKVWGLLASVSAAGVVVRGLDLAVFDDWLRQELRGEETLIGPSTLFYPIHRLERLERDETLGPVSGFADRFEREVGRSVSEVMGFVPPPSSLAS
jgi:hypothetical protein